MKEDQSRNNRLVLQYAGLATQILVSLGIAVFAGLKTDQFLKLGFPLMVCIFPLIVIIALIIKIIKDTSKK